MSRRGGQVTFIRGGIVTEEFVWTQELESGHDEIDQLHQMIMSRINHLMRDIDNASSEVFQESYSELISFIIRHYTIEEDILSELGYPDLEEHEKDHAIHIERLTDSAISEINHQDIDIEKSVQTLQQLCKDHIEKDREFFPFLRQRTSRG